MHPPVISGAPGTQPKDQLAKRPGKLQQILKLVSSDYKTLLNPSRLCAAPASLPASGACTLGVGTKLRQGAVAVWSLSVVPIPKVFQPISKTRRAKDTGVKPTTNGLCLPGSREKIPSYAPKRVRESVHLSPRVISSYIYIYTFTITIFN